MPLTVPPITLSPGVFSTGMDSPVTIDSSTAPRPSSTAPSTGTPSPGRTRKRSPTWISVRAISSSELSGRMRRPVFGVRFSSARMAPPVASRAGNSSTWSSRTRTVMTTAALEYTGTVSPMRRMLSGKVSGRKMATWL